MYFVLGLGNPGEKYAHSRHNVGFMLVEQLAEQLSGQKGEELFHFQKKFFADIFKKNDTLFIKPQTFMNESGRAAQAIIHFYQPTLLAATNASESELKQVIVIHDDLDLEVGMYKVQFGKGPKIHNGLLSIYQSLGTHQFWHVRIGVDGRGGQRAIDPADYVLAPFLKDEFEKIQQLSTNVVADILNIIKK